MSTSIHKKTVLGQFFTPPSISRFMASLFRLDGISEIRLLDPGAGTGNLSCAFMEHLLNSNNDLSSVHVDCCEMDAGVVPQLGRQMSHFESSTGNRPNCIDIRILESDFIETAVRSLSDHLGIDEDRLPSYTHCILNPPYQKISSQSRHQRLLQSIGLDVPNYYSAFTALAIMLLAPNGEMAAILPRSFCNGTYFARFRKFLLENMSLRRLHVFESRKNIFDGDVLQENIVLYAIKKRTQEPLVVLSSSRDATFQGYTEKTVPFTEIVRSGDKDRFINIPIMETDKIVLQRIGAFQQTLENLGMHVGTGPVVDFRLSDSICMEGECPLIYPYHLKNGTVVWPKTHTKKSDRILRNPLTQKWLLPNQCYTLVKRFSAKEEQRRIVAAVYHPATTSAQFIGIENHLNVFHGMEHRGLDPFMATGLAVYLNSTLVDMAFRQFSGHTQVNASDLRRLPYPDPETLCQWGTEYFRHFPKQEDIDTVVERSVATKGVFHDG